MIWKDKKPPHTSNVWESHHDIYQFFPSQELLSNKSNHRSKLLKSGIDYFKVFLLPATGPKGLVMSGFENDFIESYFEKKIRGQKFFVGASTGALRNLSLISTICEFESKYQAVPSTSSSPQLLDGHSIQDQPNYKNFKHLPELNVSLAMLNQFCDMYYKKGDTPATLRPMMDKMYRTVAPPHLLDQILNHPSLHLVILVTAFDESYIQRTDMAIRAKLAWIGLHYAVLNQCLGNHMKRMCFYTGNSPPYFLTKSCRQEDLDSDYVETKSSNELHFCKLTKENIYSVLHATTCIPSIQEKCTWIEGVGHGVFVDGAITDLMPNIKIESPHHPCLLVNDYINGSVNQAVFDHWIPWKVAQQSFFKHCSVISPSENILAHFHDGSLPSVNDYFRSLYISQPELRRKKFRQAFYLSHQHWPTSWYFESTNQDSKVITRKSYHRTHQQQNQPSGPTERTSSHSFSYILSNISTYKSRLHTMTLSTMSTLVILLIFMSWSFTLTNRS